MLNDRFQRQVEITVGYQRYRTVLIWGFMHLYLQYETFMLIHCCYFLPLKLWSRPSHTFLVMRSCSFMCVLTNAFSSASTIVRRVAEGSKGQRKSVRIATYTIFHDAGTLNLFGNNYYGKRLVKLDYNNVLKKDMNLPSPKIQHILQDGFRWLFILPGYTE